MSHNNASTNLVDRILAAALSEFRPVLLLMYDPSSNRLESSHDLEESVKLLVVVPVDCSYPIRWIIEKRKIDVIVCGTMVLEESVTRSTDHQFLEITAKSTFISGNERLARRIIACARQRLSSPPPKPNPYASFRHKFAPESLLQDFEHSKNAAEGAIILAQISDICIDRFCARHGLWRSQTGSVIAEIERKDRQAAMALQRVFEKHVSHHIRDTTLVRDLIRLFVDEVSVSSKPETSGFSVRSQRSVAGTFQRLSDASHRVEFLA